jgi:hypothetical protein
VHTSVCNDPATTKARILAFALLLVQTNNQSINQSPATAGPISPRRNYFRVRLYPFIQFIRARRATLQITARASRQNEQAKPNHATHFRKLIPLYFPSADRTNEPLTTLYSTGTYIRVHDNTGRCSLKLKLTETTSGLYYMLYFSKTKLVYFRGMYIYHRSYFYISTFLQDEASLLPGYIIWYWRSYFSQDETSLLPG